MKFWKSVQTNRKPTQTITQHPHNPPAQSSLGPSLSSGWLVGGFVGRGMCVYVCVGCVCVGGGGDCSVGYGDLGRGDPLCVCQGDCFVLDLGPSLKQWNGESAGIFEKNKVARGHIALGHNYVGHNHIGP